MFYFNAPFFFQTSSRSHHRQNSFFGFIFSLFEHSFLVCVTARRRTHTERACCLNASFLSCQEAPSSAQQLGPLHFLVAYDRSNTNSHFRILFCSISPTEETFKRSVHLADLTQASLHFSPVSRPCLGTDLGLHARLLKRPIIAHSLEPSGWEAFRRYF